MKARKLKLGINMDNGWMYCAYRNEGWNQGPITLGVMFLSRFSHLCIYFHQCFRNTFLGNYESINGKNFVTLFSGTMKARKITLFWGTMKARKLKLGMNLDNGQMYCAYCNRVQGPITLGVMFLSRFSHLLFICHYWKIFVTLFSETMKVRKLKLCINMDNGWMYGAYCNRGQGPITLRVMFLSRFSHLCIYLSSMKNFRNTFLGNYESQKAETWYEHGQWVDVSCLL